MFIREILNKIRGKGSAEAHMQYCLNHGLQVGRNLVNYSPYAIDGNWPWLVTIGDDVLLSSDVRILAHDASPLKGGASTKIGRVIIGNNVFVGAGSTILCNVRIGDNVVIGAGSVVTHDVPSNSIYAGSPAEFVCSFDSWQEKHLNNMETHPIFNQRRWDDWKNATEAEWEEMRQALEDTFGYL